MSRLTTLRRALPILLLAALAPAAQAQMFKDAALDALFAAGRFDELDRVAGQRLARQADDPHGTLALALAVTRGGDATLRQRALAAAEACVQRQPQLAACQYALGVVLGVQAASEGMLSMASSVGRVRTALQAALQAEPGWFPARNAVVDFHLLAPGLIGGSLAKAREIAAAAPHPAQARALQARIALQQRQPDVALQALAEVASPDDSAVAASLIESTLSAAFGLVNAGQAVRAQPLFERVARERPVDARAVFGLARVQAEAGAHEAALALFARSATLQGAALLPIDYRVGLSQLALGRHAEGRASLQRFVSAGRGQRAQLDDAKQRLAQAGS